LVLPVLHTAPWPLRPHEFELQVLGDLHWSLVAQTLKHSEPLQTYGAQGSESGATHWPVVLQVDGPVKMPVAQVCSAHFVPAA
jgi:6-phosphogluconate dehydrogenase (decarboxylating)